MTRQVRFSLRISDALEIEAAHPFDLHTGQALSDLEIGILRPVWCVVRGKVTGALPEDLSNVCVHFVRDVGTLDDFGGGGPPVKADRAFEGPAQPGRYRLSVRQMTPPASEGYIHGTKQFGSAEITVGDRDLAGVEIAVS